MINYYKQRLDNGLEVILSPNNNLHSASISVGFNYGLFNENNEVTGVSHLIEHMLFEGAAKFSKKTLRNFLDNNTLYWNGETSAEKTVYKFKFLNLSKSQYVFDTISEMIFDSVFPEENLKKEKNALTNEVHANYGEDLVLEGAITRAYLFRKPVTTFLGGDPVKVEELSKDTLIDIYSKYYCPGNAIISIAGNFNRKRVMESINDSFGNIKKENIRPNLEAYIGKTEYRSVHMKSFRPYSGQSSIIFGMKLPGASELYKKSEEGVAALNYIRDILSSRLLESMRDKAGLVYLADSDISIGRHTGYLVTYAEVKNKDLEEVKKIMFNEIEKIINGDVIDKNAKKSKISLKASLADTFDSTLDHSSYILDSVLEYGKDPNEIYKEIMNLKEEDVQAAAAEYLKTEGKDNSFLLISN